jgi:hypothetical protein
MKCDNYKACGNEAEKLNQNGLLCQDCFDKYIDDSIKEYEHYIIHSTSYNESLELLLKDGYLQGHDDWAIGYDKGIGNYDPSKKYHYQVFTQIVCPFWNKYLYNCKDEEAKDMIHFIFNPNIVYQYNCHWIPGWGFGKYHIIENPTKKNSKSFYDFVDKKTYSNLLLSNGEYHSVYGVIHSNELVFNFRTKKSAKLSLRHLLYIYVHPENEHIEELRELASKYSEFNWVFKCPIKESNIKKN